MTEAPVAYKYRPLSGKKIVLGLTGGIAIYRSVDLVRELVRMGAVVKPVFTPKAVEFINPLLFEWASGEKPVTRLSGRAEHVLLSNEYDAMVIAPATLNTMSKIAYGVGDNPVTLTAIAFLGAGKPVIMVPSMNLNLYNTPQYREIVKKLYEIGAVVIPPLISEDKAKYPPLSDLVYCIDALLDRGRDMAGYNVLVTAGPTREYIDPVRVLTNPSTGYMGVTLAREICCRGGYVLLVHGPLAHEPPYLADRIEVETTLEMAEEVKKACLENTFDAAIFAAAPADYRPVQKASKKIPSRMGEITVKLRPTVKVVKALKSRPRVLVVFAAETVSGYDELVSRAMEKLEDYDADLVVANRVGVEGRGFGSEYIDLCLVSRDGHECLGVVHKAFATRRIIDWVSSRLGEGKD